MSTVTRAVQAMGMDATFERADDDDPLGGVITVRGPDVSPIQIVNFYNPRATVDNPGWAAIQSGHAAIGFCKSCTSSKRPSASS